MHSTFALDLMHVYGFNYHSEQTAPLVFCIHQEVKRADAGNGNRLYNGSRYAFGPLFFLSVCLTCPVSSATLV